MRQALTILLITVLVAAGVYVAWRGSRSATRPDHLLAAGRPAGGTCDERLQVAAAEDDLDRVRDLIRNGVSVARGTATLHVTPLHDAAGNCDARMIRELLAAGADPNARTVSGETPLMQIDRCRTGAESALQALLDGGADINATDGKGLTALDRAERRGNEALTQMLRRGGATMNESPAWPSDDQ